MLVKTLSSKSPGVALRIGTISAALLFIGAAWFVIAGTGLSSNIWWAVVTGAVGGIVIGLVAEYYTASEPVRKIARAGGTGAATVMIAGLALGMQSVVIPVLTISGIIYVSTELAGL
ncbi:MAG: K(+)-stimulated pyrophosphate-energized sodium pump [Paracoccaceae bacterium]|jgi:K(+)-stimulated pyrophosphate-energized sodium pump